MRLRESKPVRILIADPDPFVRNFLAHLLARQNCRVACAQSLAEATAICLSPTLDFDILLKEVLLPDATGIELSRLLKKKGPT